MRKRYKKRTSIVSDSVFIGARLPWWGSFIFGMLSFTFFYFIIPEWLQTKLTLESQSMFYPILDTILGRRIHWFQWIGVASGLIGLFFGIRNYFLGNSAGYYERWLVGFLIKMFSRDLI